MKTEYVLILAGTIVFFSILFTSISRQRANIRERMRLHWLHLTSLEGCDQAQWHFENCLRLSETDPTFLERIGCPDTESLQQAACISIMLRTEWLSRRIVGHAQLRCRIDDLNQQLEEITAVDV